MRKKYLLLLVATACLVAGVAHAGNAWVRVTQTTYCTTVDDSPAVTILAANNDRIRWSIWTTSGAATIYFREDGTATAPAGAATEASGALVAGQSYTEDYAATTTAVSAITKSGSAWLCAKEAVSP